MAAPAAHPQQEHVLEEMSPLAIWCWLIFFDLLAWFGIILAVDAAVKAVA